MFVLHFTGKLPPSFYIFGGVLNRRKEDPSFDLYLGEDAKSDIDKRLDIEIKIFLGFCCIFLRKDTLATKSYLFSNIFRQSLKKHPSIVKKGRGNTGYTCDRASKVASHGCSANGVSHISGEHLDDDGENTYMIPKVNFSCAFIYILHLHSIKTTGIKIILYKIVSFIYF